MPPFAPKTGVRAAAPTTKAPPDLVFEVQNVVIATCASRDGLNQGAMGSAALQTAGDSGRTYTLTCAVLRIRMDSAYGHPATIPQAWDSAVRATASARLRCGSLASGAYARIATGLKADGEDFTEEPHA